MGETEEMDSKVNDSSLIKQACWSAKWKKKQNKHLLSLADRSKDISS